MTPDHRPALPARPRILVVGAGVLGTVYAAKLALDGHDVTVAEVNDARRHQIEKNGLVVESLSTRTRDTVRVPVMGSITPDADFDLAIAIIRKTHLDSVISAIAPTRIGSILFMVSNAEGPELFTRSLGSRALLGFPGAGGSRDGDVVRYSIPPKFMQQTMLAEIDGSRTPRVTGVAAILDSAGFSTSIPTDFDAWMKSHEAFVASTGNATYAAGGSGARLGRDRELLDLNITAIREVLAAMDALRIPVTPGYFRLWQRLPLPVIRATFGRFLASSSWELGTEQLISMRDEVEVITDELRDLAARAGLSTPAMDTLARLRDAA